MNKTIQSKLSHRSQLLQLSNPHYSPKPRKLMEMLLKAFVPPNGNVIDPFMGSGTTIEAAKKLQIPFIGIEKEDEYFEYAKKRCLNQ